MSSTLLHGSHHRSELDERLERYGRRGGVHPAIGELLRQGHIPERATIADIHSTERAVSTRNENQEALSRQGVKRVGDQQRFTRAAG